jgi:hypothetical protein
MNQSKMKDPRFWKKWLVSGAVPKQPINIDCPFNVIAVGTNEISGWNTISIKVPSEEKYQYFVTKSNLELGQNNVISKNSFNFEQGLPLVLLKVS